MSHAISSARLLAAYQRAKAALLDQRNEAGHWVGELSTSALSTATATMALEMVRRHGGEEFEGRPLAPLIDGGLNWLAEHQNADGGWGDTVRSFSNISTTMLAHAVFVATSGERGAVRPPVLGELDSQRTGGLTPPRSPGANSFDPIRTGGLTPPRSPDTAMARAQAYIDKAGGVPAVVARYGKDKTFSVPILTHCALAGLVDWKQITPLPFELACLPARFYAAVRLPVVSYALPALIAIGQARYRHAPPWNPLTRWWRKLALEPSLKVLERIQPPNGGFLEAAPLTSFVTMSLAASGLVQHPVVQQGVRFLLASVRPDGSWPIDTNLATWVTTLSVNALGEDLPSDAREPILRWLLDQQYKVTHPYTNAAPGGWAWTDLPGGVPDADDTPGAVLAVAELTRDSQTDSERGMSAPRASGASAKNHDPNVCDYSARPNLIAKTTEHDQAEMSSPSPAWHGGLTSPARCLSSDESTQSQHVKLATENALHWLLGIQNRDGGFPTFCRGWGALPFDRSSADLTAHCVRAMQPRRVTREIQRLTQSLGFHSSFGSGATGEGFDSPVSGSPTPETLAAQSDRQWHPTPEDATLLELLQQAMDRGFHFLAKQQRPDGSWLPLWFGNQHAPDDINPTYGTAKVLLAYRDCGLIENTAAQRGIAWLRANQNVDGGWGSVRGTPSSVEETALALETLLSTISPVSPRSMTGGQPEMANNNRSSSESVANIIGTAHSTSAAGEQTSSERPPVIDRGLTGQNGIEDLCLSRGLEWLIARVEAGTWTEPAPIGFYFAKLWYFERLYPMICTVAALRQAVLAVRSS